MLCARCHIQAFNRLSSKRNQIRTRVMGRSKKYFHFFIYYSKPNSNDEKKKKLQRDISLRFPNTNAIQLQAIATVTITHEEIWISPSSNNPDCLTNKYWQLGDRECLKGDVRWSWGLITWVGWQGQVTGTSGERHGGDKWTVKGSRMDQGIEWGHQHWFIQKLISGDRPGHKGKGSSPSLGLITHWQETDPAWAKVALIRVTLTTFTQTEPDLASVHVVCGKSLNLSLTFTLIIPHSYRCGLTTFSNTMIFLCKHHTGWT